MSEHFYSHSGQTIPERLLVTSESATFFGIYHFGSDFCCEKTLNISNRLSLLETVIVSFKEGKRFASIEA